MPVIVQLYGTYVYFAMGRIRILVPRRRSGHARRARRVTLWLRSGPTCRDAELSRPERKNQFPADHPHGCRVERAEVLEKPRRVDRLDVVELNVRLPGKVSLLTQSHVGWVAVSAAASKGLAR
jgi:hypothetical protein